MKFAIEAAGLTVAGGKELALDLMSRLAGHAEHQFILFVPDLEDYKNISGSNIRLIVCKKGAGLVQRARLLNHTIPKICREERADALLCLGNFVPWKQVCPTAVLLQNAWIVYGDPVADSRRTFREHLITAYGRQAYRHLPSDVTIITQTPVMKGHLCQRYGIAPERVAIVPNALSIEKLGTHRRRADFGGNHESKPFRFLCLAHCYAHKNIDILLDAIERLPRFTPNSAKCVITVAPEHHPSARRLLQRLGQGELAVRVQNIGPVPSRMLPEIYQNADALIFPTLLESFSRTYLEALHFGLPILTSDRDFAHNLCQDAAVYFDPLDAESVARAMARVMDDAGWRERLVENGRRILAQSPSWDDIAARFVEVLERTAEKKIGSRQEALGSKHKAGRAWQEGEGSRHKAGGSGQARIGSGEWGVAALGTGRKAVGSGQTDLPPTASGLRLSAECMVPSFDRGPRTADCRVPSAYCLLPTPPHHAVRTLFNQKARGWRSKYGSRGTLNSRVKQFAARLEELCPPPARILDFGCGTGEIAAALDRRGYRVAACDFAEEMMAVARGNYSHTAVDCVGLDSDWTRLPFPGGAFDGIVASSVFEYLDDVPRVAAEIYRVLRLDGVLLLTVPNPANSVRQLEARLRALPLGGRLSPLLHRFERLDSYATYLRLSRNRFEAPEWQSVLHAAHFAPVDRLEFSRPAWQRQAHAPLVLLAVRKMVAAESGQFAAAATLCRAVEG